MLSRLLILLFSICMLSCTSVSDQFLIDVSSDIKLSPCTQIENDVLDAAIKGWVSSIKEHELAIRSEIRVSTSSSENIYYSGKTGERLLLPQEKIFHELKVVGTCRRKNGVWIMLQDTNICFIRLNVQGNIAEKKMWIGQ